MWCFVAECGEAHARASTLHDETGTAPPHHPLSRQFLCLQFLQLAGYRVHVSVTACFPVLSQQRQ